MINIRIQCCGMIILWITSYFYWRSPRINIRTKKMFSKLLVCTNICVISDIVSILFICNTETVPRNLVYASCKIYLLFLMGMVYYGLLYICSDIYKNEIKFMKRTIWYHILFIISEIAMLVLPINFVCKDEKSVIYSYGPSTMIAYIFFASFFMIMLTHMYIARKEILTRRKRAVSSWLIIWLGSALWQFWDSSFLIVTFSGILGVSIIFNMIENPELSLDRESSFFHISAMIQYMSELYETGIEFSLICIQYDREEREFYKQIKGANIFVGGGEIYFLFLNTEYTKIVLEQLKKRFDRHSIYVVLNSFIVNNSNELLAFLKEAQTGRGKWENFSEICILDKGLKDKIKEYKNVEKLIEDAIKNDRIEVYYQPIYSIQDESFYSAEALMRIRDAKGNIVLPNVFIPVAEAEGTIIELGKILFDKVCLFLNNHKNNKLLFKYIEVNLSVILAEGLFLADNILDTMKKYNITSEQINLEITESASVKGKQQLLKNMHTLKQHGIKFSLDDFGTGQSNLDYMASMPVQIVKFDYTMIHNYFVSEKTKSIMNAAIHMIHEMNMEIVAEGIESKEQFECMKKLGIEYIQGYYFSKPMPENDLLSFLEKTRG